MRKFKSVEELIKETESLFNDMAILSTDKEEIEQVKEVLTDWLRVRPGNHSEKLKELINEADKMIQS